MNLPIRLSVSEAAKFFGVEQKTVRRAIKRQEIKYIVVRGRYKLDFINLLKWSQKKTTIRNKLHQLGVGQFVDRWKINNKLYSPNPKRITRVLESASGDSCGIVEEKRILNQKK